MLSSFKEVKSMVFARVASWKFKPDQRKRGLDMLENSVAELVRRTEGFRESLILLSRDDANLSIIITLWNSEEEEKIFAEGVFKKAVQELEPFVMGPPVVTHHTVYSSELKQ
jgi:heme-degrading monooxygenase HmoA